VLNLKSTLKIKKTVSHQSPDLDALGAIWLAKKFGQKKFSGIDKAPIEFLPGGLIMPDGRTGDDWLKDGILVVDMGGGRFDHHQYSSKDNQQNQRCAATLVAEFLEIREDLALKQILQSIAINDLFGESRAMDLAHLIKDRNAIDKDPQETFAIVSQWLDDAYAAQQLFVEALEVKSTTAILSLTGDRKIKIATALTDNPQAAKALRSNLKADVVMIKNSRGNVQIFNRTVDGVQTVGFGDVVRILRYEEQRKAGKITVTDWKLGQEKAVPGPGIELWYYLANPRNGIEMLLNGSQTVEKPPTQLSEDEIMRAITIGIDQDYCSPGCNPQECSKCEFYPYGLKRCQKKKSERQTQRVLRKRN